MNHRTAPVSIIGAPTDIGAGHRGARLGPEALRIAGIGEALAARGVDVIDRGNLDGPRNPWQPPVEGYRHLPEVVAWNRLVMDAVLAELHAGRMPILLGGDHCLGVGSITAVANHCRATGKQLRVLWLDAHADSALLGHADPDHSLPRLRATKRPRSARRRACRPCTSRPNASSTRACRHSCVKPAQTATWCST